MCEYCEMHLVYASVILILWFYFDFIFVCNFVLVNLLSWLLKTMFSLWDNEEINEMNGVKKHNIQRKYQIGGDLQAMWGG